MPHTYTTTNENHDSAGFTLVELLVVAPIVMLSITFLVALMVSLVGSVMTSKERSAVLYETQSTLNTIEQDIVTAGAFTADSGALISPQGRDDLTAAWTTSSDSAFIIKGFASDKNPLDTTRKPIFYMNKPNACGASENMNTPFITNTIYYLRNGSLWRRTYLPNYNTNTGSPDTNTVCTAPWQRNSCKVGYTDTARCKTNDVEVLEGVTNFTVDYYASSTATSTTTPDNATVVNVSITVSRTVSGNTISNTSYLKIAKQNKLYDMIMPETPIIATTPLSPTSVQFSWPSSGEGVRYDIYQNLNGGAWTLNQQNSTNLSITLSGYPTQTVGVRVEAKNSNGIAAGSAVYSFARWMDASLQNGWVHHTTIFSSEESSPPSYTITQTGEVFLRGIIKSGTTTSGTLLFTLPAGMRPDYTLAFPVMSGTGVGRIEILTNGQVLFMAGEATFVSLDGIRFMSAGSCTMTALTQQNGWTDSAGFSPATACVTSDNRVHVQGVVQNATVSAATIGTAAAPVAMKSFPATTSYQNSGWQVFPSSGYLRNYYNVGVNPPATPAVTARGQYTAGSNLSMQIDYANTAVTGWLYGSGGDLSNSWVNYGGNYTGYGFTKVANDVVTMRGTVKSGTSTDAGAGKNLDELIAGYFPAYRMIFLVSGNGAACRIDVKATGTVEFQGGSCSTTMTSIDSITFIAEG